MTDIRGSAEGLAEQSVDMRLAGKVQALLFPKSTPACDWCCVGVNNRMAAVLGGDFYDFITLDDGCQVVLIGDVTGHGLHASIIMSLVYGYLHQTVQGGCDPLATVSELNRFLRSFARRSFQYDHFFSATLFFGIIDPGDLNMRYVSAGHTTGLVRRRRELLRLPATGHPLGYFDHPELVQQTFQFAADDRCLLYTDGLIDGLSPSGEVFGAGRLEKLLLASDQGYLEFLGELFDRAIGHLGGQPISDDCTAIVLDMHAPRPVV